MTTPCVQKSVSAHRFRSYKMFYEYSLKKRSLLHHRALKKREYDIYFFIIACISEIKMFMHI